MVISFEFSDCKWAVGETIGSKDNRISLRFLYFLELKKKEKQ